MELKKLADQGKEPYASLVKTLLTKYANVPRPGRQSVSGLYTVVDRKTFEDHFFIGGYTLYAKAIAYVFTADTTYAAEVKKRLLDLTDISGFSGGDSPIMLGWQLPAWIQSADLLTGYSGWGLTEKHTFQKWLAEVPSRACSRSGRIADNNWGSTCGYLNAMIADYVSDSGFELIEESPAPRRLSPAIAYQEYTNLQLKRMSYKTVPMQPKSSACQINGIMSYGGIPAETRRASGSVDLSWCYLEYLPSGSGSAFIYQITHLGGTIPHAELAYRRGNSSLYSNIAPDGSGSLLKAIKYIIANPVRPDKSYDWNSNKKSLLHMANYYYRDHDITVRLDGGTKNTSGDDFRGHYVYFTKLTHHLSDALPLSTPVNLLTTSPTHIFSLSHTLTKPRIPTPSRTLSPTPIMSPTPIAQICDGTIDVDGNGKVTIIDFMWVVIHFGQTVSGGVREGDLNCDGRVTTIDYVTWININYAASLKR